MSFSDPLFKGIDYRLYGGVSFKREPPAGYVSVPFSV
jgi:hypothetical protein